MTTSLTYWVLTYEIGNRHIIVCSSLPKGVIIQIPSFECLSAYFQLLIVLEWYHMSKTYANVKKHIICFLTGFCSGFQIWPQNSHSYHHTWYIQHLLDVYLHFWMLSDFDCISIRYKITLSCGIYFSNQLHMYTWWNQSDFIYLDVILDLP